MGGLAENEHLLNLNCTLKAQLAQFARRTELAQFCSLLEVLELQRQRTQFLRDELNEIAPKHREVRTETAENAEVQQCAEDSQENLCVRLETAQNRKSELTAQLQRVQREMSRKITQMKTQRTQQQAELWLKQRHK